jgi:FkbM family methyltransferase
VKAHIVNSGRELTFLSKYPADLIASLAAGLIVDVGAATGETTLTARKANPACRVISYEPFPGNLTYLERAVKDDPMVTVRPVAVADYEGSGTLFLPSIISDRKRVAGSSRVGKLNPFPFRKAVAKVRVPVIRLDDEIREHVRFLKVDIQVGEFHVLNGARGLISQYGIDLIYVEFRGDLRLLRLLDQSGYTIIDCAYMAWPHRRYWRNLFRAKLDWTIPNLEVLRTGDLSTGQRGRHVWPRVPVRSFAGYCAWFYFERIFVTGLQTDLLCVHKSYQDEFEKLCRLINPDSSV